MLQSQVGPYSLDIDAKPWHLKPCGVPMELERNGTQECWQV